MANLDVREAVLDERVDVQTSFRRLDELDGRARAGMPRCKDMQQSSYGSIEMSYVSMRCASATISALSLPISGRKTGMFAAASVQAIAWIVWLATCPRLSPVISAPQSFSRAMRSAARIMKRRMMTVASSSGQLSRICS